MKSGAALEPIMPTSFEECVRMSRAACAAGILPKIKVGTYPKKREENDTEQEMRGAMIIMQGLEVGLPPMQALQLIAMINGKMTVHSEGIPALLWSKGFKIHDYIEGEDDERVAHCYVTRPDGTKIHRTFSVKDAKKAGLWSPEAKIKKNGKSGTYETNNDSPWHKYDYRMLKARALGFAARDGAADALRGIWVREEAEDIDRMKDITPVKAVEELPNFDAIPDGTTDGIDDQPDDMIADVDGFLKELESELAIAGNDEKIRAEIAEQYEDVIERLPDDAKGRANEMLETAE
jgi:hypothetical protein